MDLNSVATLVWRAISVDATILLLQWPYSDNGEGSPVIRSPPGHQEGVRPQVCDVSALGAYDVADIAATGAGETADVGRAGGPGGCDDEPIWGEDKAISSFHINPSTCNAVTI